MKITPKQYAILLYELTKDAKKNALTEVVQSFVKILMRGRALLMLPRILELYKAYYNAQEGVVDVEVTTAREFSRLEKTVAQAFRPEEVRASAKGGSASGGKALSYNVVANVDPTVLGGARIRIGDYMLDDTLKARLRALRNSL